MLESLPLSRTGRVAKKNPSSIIGTGCFRALKGAPAVRPPFTRLPRGNGQPNGLMPDWQENCKETPGGMHGLPCWHGRALGLCQSALVTCFFVWRGVSC